MRRKEAELNAALIQYAARCVAEGDEVALTDLGLDRRDAETIEAFYLTDIDHLSSLHFVLLAKGAIDVICSIGLSSMSNISVSSSRCGMSSSPSMPRSP